MKFQWVFARNLGNFGPLAKKYIDSEEGRKTAGEGFDPPLSGQKSGVLPLHQPAFHDLFLIFLYFKYFHIYPIRVFILGIIECFTTISQADNSRLILIKEIKYISFLFGLEVVQTLQPKLWRHLHGQICFL